MTFHELMINFVHDVINYSRKIVTLEQNWYEKEKITKNRNNCCTCWIKT